MFERTPNRMPMNYNLVLECHDNEKEFNEKNLTNKMYLMES